MSVAGGGKKKPHRFLRSLTCDRIPLTPQGSQGTKGDSEVGSDLVESSSTKHPKISSRMHD